MSERQVKLAKTAGFCFGVKRAVNTVYEQIETGKSPIYTYGPIIHNEEVVKDLEERGVKVLNDENDIDNADSNGTIIIRSHGVAKTIYDKTEKKGMSLIDATCPFVKKIHKIVSEKGNEGYHIIIIGNDKHPEVEGIKGWCVGSVTVINSEEEASEFEILNDKKVCIVSQTTYNYNKFHKLVEIIEKKVYNVIIVNTICNATNERQVEAKQIATEAESMIVIGGKTSSNTQKLYEICKEECENTYYIQTAEDLRDVSLGDGVVGITAGASTPKNIIEEVQANVRFKF
ncbi:MAG: 4-hydroxy-3-methylbut-2-enyl diphosphate reductase [Lachnospiraceae bacterium]|nr:4-hydroxy-3-methylbut-2-enyl diphosphate reductase [Lachnospiraceae bacterium]